MQYYDEVQEVNERRKRRILAYYEYIDGVAPLVRTGGSRHTGLAAPPHHNKQKDVLVLGNTDSEKRAC